MRVPPVGKGATVKPMLNRRECLALTANACALLALGARPLSGQQRDAVLTRPIPSTGEQLPIIGLGSAASFWGFDELDIDAVRDVMQVMIENGGTVFDTAPDYLASEEVAAKIVNELGIRDRMFWATKLPAFRSGSADRGEIQARLATSFERLGREPIDLIQVLNVDADAPMQLAMLKELKEQGRVRYIGAVATAKARYEPLERCMRTEPLDFIGIDYAVDNRSAEERLFPVARDRGIAVMVYTPFRQLWGRVKGREVPPWAVELGARSWAQFFLKFAASHPAVTVVTPATAEPEHMLDNLLAARGHLPDEAERRRMIEFVEQLPPSTGRDD
jgi:aryl-alcohol dehydrogenase-like predicted oxidoreductase